MEQDGANGVASNDGDDGFQPVEGEGATGADGVDAGGEESFLPVEAARPATVRRVICPDCRGLVEVRGAANEKGRVHVQCGACGRQALIPAATAAKA